MGAPRIDLLDTNFLINGNDDYNQRAASLNSAGYLSDRWRAALDSGTIAQSMSSDVPDLRTFQALQINGTSAANIRIIQTVESLFSRALVGRVVVFKIKAKVIDSTGIPLVLTIRYLNAKDSIAATTTIVSTSYTPTVGAWTTYTAIATIPAGGVNGLECVATRQGTGTTSTIYSQRTLTIKNEAPDEFCYAGKNIFHELNILKRYYEKSYHPDVYPGATGNIGSLFFVAHASLSYLGGIIRHEQKRIVPVAICYSTGNGTAGFMSVDAAEKSVVVSAGITQTRVLVNNSSTSVLINSFGTFHLTLDADF